MKAILLEEHGPPEVLKLVELADPEPGADEILVKAVAIGVGVPDVLVRSGRYGWMPKLPVVPGIEMTGVVARAGAAIEGIAVGDHVIVSAREREERGGCYAQYIAVKPSAVYKLPAGVDLDAAAALANYQVAWHMIHSASRTRPGDTVLVFGAAGGVGSAAVEVARLAGLRPIAVVGGEQRVALVQRLGAVAAIDRTRESVLDRVRHVTNGRGVDLILDAIGGTRIGERLQLLAPFGTLLSYGALIGPPSGDIISAMRDNFDLSPGFRRFTMHSLDHQPELRREATEKLIAHLAAGEIAPRIHAVLPLAEASAAHRMLEAGDVEGKLLLRP